MTKKAHKNATVKSSQTNNRATRSSFGRTRTGTIIGLESSESQKQSRRKASKSTKSASSGEKAEAQGEKMEVPNKTSDTKVAGKTDLDPEISVHENKPRPLSQSPTKLEKSVSEQKQSKETKSDPTLLAEKPSLNNDSCRGVKPKIDANEEATKSHVDCSEEIDTTKIIKLKPIAGASVIEGTVEIARPPFGSAIGLRQNNYSKPPVSPSKSSTSSSKSNLPAQSSSLPRVEPQTLALNTEVHIQTVSAPKSDSVTESNPISLEDKISKSTNNLQKNTEAVLEVSKSSLNTSTSEKSSQVTKTPSPLMHNQDEREPKSVGVVSNKKEDKSMVPDQREKTDTSFSKVTSPNKTEVRADNHPKRLIEKVSDSDIPAVQRPGPAALFSPTVPLSAKSPLISQLTSEKVESPTKEKNTNTPSPKPVQPLSESAESKAIKATDVSKNPTKTTDSSSSKEKSAMTNTEGPSTQVADYVKVKEASGSEKISEPKSVQNIQSVPTPNHPEMGKKMPEQKKKHPTVVENSIIKAVQNKPLEKGSSERNEAEGKQINVTSINAKFPNKVGAATVAGSVSKSIKSTEPMSHAPPASTASTSTQQATPKPALTGPVQKRVPSLAVTASKAQKQTSLVSKIEEPVLRISTSNPTLPGSQQEAKTEAGASSTCQSNIPTPALNVVTSPASTLQVPTLASKFFNGSKNQTTEKVTETNAKMSESLLELESKPNGSQKEDVAQSHTLGDSSFEPKSKLVPKSSGKRQDGNDTESVKSLGKRPRDESTSSSCSKISRTDDNSNKDVLSGAQSIPCSSNAQSQTLAASENNTDATALQESSTHESSISASQDQMEEHINPTSTDATESEALKEDATSIVRKLPPTQASNHDANSKAASESHPENLETGQNKSTPSAKSDQNELSASVSESNPSHAVGIVHDEDSSQFKNIAAEQQGECRSNENIASTHGNEPEQREGQCDGSSKKRPFGSSDHFSSSQSSNSVHGLGLNFPPSCVTEKIAVHNESISKFNRDDLTHLQFIESITRKEALRHVEMAWKAHQRLVRRCLGLRLANEMSKAKAKDATG